MARYARIAMVTKSLFLVALLLSGCSERPRYTPLLAGSVVVAFGDSVTYGTGASREHSYPTQLAQRSGWDVVNAGIPGDTAKEARGRIDAVLEEYHPDMVIIGLGGNDFLARRPGDLVKEDLRSIIHAVRDAGGTPVLISVPALSVVRAAAGNLADAALYAELAREEDVMLIRDVFSDVLSNRSLRADAVHPNAEGYRVFTRGIVEALVKAGLLTQL